MAIISEPYLSNFEKACSSEFQNQLKSNLGKKELIGFNTKSKKKSHFKAPGKTVTLPHGVPLEQCAAFPLLNAISVTKKLLSLRSYFIKFAYEINWDLNHLFFSSLGVKK